MIAQHVKPCASINGLSLGSMVIRVGALEGSLESALTCSFVGVRLTCQRHVAGLQCPIRTVAPSKLTDAMSASTVSVAVHPASHSWPIDINVVGMRCGTICAANASSGSIGAIIGRLDVWLEMS